MGTVEGDQAQFIEALTPTRLVEELAYLNQRGQRNAYPLWQQMSTLSTIPGSIEPDRRRGAPARGRSRKHGFAGVLRRDARKN